MESDLKTAFISQDPLAERRSCGLGRSKCKSPSHEEGSYPKVRFFSRISSVSSGAQLLLPQMAGPPTGSMPMPAPQVRKSAARRRAGTSFSPRNLLIRPMSAVSRVSPAQVTGALSSERRNVQSTLPESLVLRLIRQQTTSRNQPPLSSFR